MFLKKILSYTFGEWQSLEKKVYDFEKTLRTIDLPAY